MSFLYAMSDIHGKKSELDRVFRLLGAPGCFDDPQKTFVFLGDYIDRGPDSFGVLNTVFRLDRTHENVIALRGNHEEWFLDFLDKGEDPWLAEDRNLQTSRTFLTPEQLERARKIAFERRAGKAREYLRTCIKNSHPDLLAWMRALPFVYETPKQIFVHAGVDEEAGEYWKLGTPDYVFTGKFPPTTGKFLKDVIAGHTAADSVAWHRFHLPGYKGVFWDGESHYFIDGGGRLLCLAYDEESGTYFELVEDENGEGVLKPVLPPRPQGRGDVS